MKTKTLLLRRALFLCAFLLGFFGESLGQSTTLNLTMQDAFFPTQFNNGGDFYNSGASELGMWANTGAKQTVAWRDFNTAGDNTGSARSLQIGDEFSITVRCTKAYGQIGFSLNASGTQGGSYANNVSGSKLRINTDNYGSWYISNGSTSSLFNYNPSENTYRDYKFVIKILSPTLVTASLFVDNTFYSSVQNFSLLSTNPITAFSIYGSDMWDGSSNDDAFWKNCSVTSSTTVELGYALTSGNITPGLITNGLAANSTSTSSVNTVFVGGNSGTSVIFNQPCTYSGLTQVNQNATLQLNNTGGGTLPSTNSINVNGTLIISSNQTLVNLTINSGGTVLVDANVQLTLTGALTNNGTLTLENGATFIQGTSLAGSGTYNVKQTVTGAGGAGSAPTGRFWYMGVPLNNLTRGAAFGSAGTDNRLWSWTESGQPQWSSTITDNNAPLVPTTGYVFRTSAPSTTLNFSGTSLYSIDASIPNLSNSGGSFAGCHLMSNPYTAYLDWEQIFTASTNISSTYCIPTSNGSSMVYDTYNATGNVAVNPSNVAMTNFIAPMQAFWVVVNPSTQGTLNMTKAMLSHQAGAVGLKDITSFPAFARLNLVSGDFYDQVVIYTDANATSEVEDYDSKKFFLPNKAQVYCPVGNDKLVINALKKGKAQTSAPLTVELPSTQIYTFEMSESFVENGLVVLEDKQEKIFQDMGVNPIYEFFGNTGVIADRFVLHFQLPNGTNNEGQAGIEDLTSGQIAVIANHDGAVTVALSADLTTSGDIQIFDGAGRLIAQKAISSAQTSLQLDNRTGVYFVRVQTPMKTETKKVMVY
jgi:hypothetical protein